MRSGGFAWVGQAAVGKALAALAGVGWLGGRWVVMLALRGRAGVRRSGELAKNWRCGGQGGMGGRLLGDLAGGLAGGGSFVRGAVNHCILGLVAGRSGGLAGVA